MSVILVSIKEKGYHFCLEITKAKDILWNFPKIPNQQKHKYNIKNIIKIIIKIM